MAGSRSIVGIASRGVIDSHESLRPSGLALQDVVSSNFTNRRETFCFPPRKAPTVQNAQYQEPSLRYNGLGRLTKPTSP